MIALIRLGFFGLIALTVLYFLVSWYSRSVRREKLEGWADEKIAEGALEPAARDTYIEEGMRDYDVSLRKKLILGVYVVPIIAVTVLIYMTNFM